MKENSENDTQKFNRVSSKRHLDLKKLLYEHFKKGDDTAVQKPKGTKKKNKK